MQSPLQAETLPVSRLVPKGTQGENPCCIMGKVMLGLFPKDLRVKAWSRVAAVGAGNDYKVEPGEAVL